MKPSFAGRWTFVLMALASLAVPARTQTAAATAKPSAPFRYDAAAEITLHAAVSKVLERPSHGMIMGAHLMLQTSSGTVDASLGRFAFAGKDALSVAPGAQIEVTGVMKTINGSLVLLVRTLKVNGQVHAIRTRQGLPISPAARERAAQKGVAL